MTAKLLTEFLSLKGGGTGLSESTLVIMPHCWKSHVAANFSINIDFMILGFQNPKLYQNLMFIVHLNNALAGSSNGYV